MSKTNSAIELRAGISDVVMVFGESAIAASDVGCCG
jgi:hypothetical protein